MFVVAVTRWSEGLATQLPELAQMLGVFAYDLRAKLSVPVPAVAAQFEEREAAIATIAKLRGWGHGAVGCDLATVPSSDEMFAPKAFELGQSQITLRDARGGAKQLVTSEIHTMIHAVAVSETATETEKQTKKFSAGRAVLSGGLLMSRKVKSMTRETDTESEQLLYVSHGPRWEPAVFGQHRLHYGGLGDRKGYSSTEGFATLVETMRTLAPGALYDKRLMKGRRPTTTQAITVSRQSAKSTTSTTRSNASGVDLAAHLLALGHHAGQL